jgi:hypothetical protein
MARAVRSFSTVVFTLMLAGARQHCYGQAVPETADNPQPGRMEPSPVTACEQPDRTLLKSHGGLRGITLT